MRLVLGVVLGHQCDTKDEGKHHAQRCVNTYQ